LTRLAPWDPLAFLARLRKSHADRLLAACHLLAASTALERAALAPAHGAFNGLCSAPGITPCHSHTPCTVQAACETPARKKGSMFPDRPLPARTPTCAGQRTNQAVSRRFWRLLLGILILQGPRSAACRALLPARRHTSQRK